MRDALIAALSRRYGTHAYAKWSGAFWRLISLVDLGVEPGHPGAVTAAEQTLRRRASMEGRALQAALDGGLRGDPRLDALAESLVETQWPDGGWNCHRRRECTHARPSAGRNAEVVDWGTAANDVLTEQARDVLAAAGRL